MAHVKDIGFKGEGVTMKLYLRPMLFIVLAIAIHHIKTSENQSNKQLDAMMEQLKEQEQQDLASLLYYEQQLVIARTCANANRKYQDPLCTKENEALAAAYQEALQRKTEQKNKAYDAARSLINKAMQHANTLANKAESGGNFISALLAHFYFDLDFYYQKVSANKSSISLGPNKDEKLP